MCRLTTGIQILVILREADNNISPFMFLPARETLSIAWPDAPPLPLTVKKVARVDDFLERLKDVVF